MSDTSPESLARLFHDTYESLAPDHGYKPDAELHRLLNDLAWATSHEQGAPAARRAVEEYFRREVSRG